MSSSAFNTDCFAADKSEGRSDRHDLFLLSLSKRVDLLDVLIGQILNSLFGLLYLVLGHLVCLLHLLAAVVCVAADIANSDLCLLAELLGLFCDLAAALLVERGEAETDDLTVVDRGNTEIGCLDSLADILKELGLPRLNYDSASIGDLDLRYVVYGRGAAVVINIYLGKKRGICSAYTISVEIFLLYGYRLLHSCFKFFGIKFHFNFLLNYFKICDYLYLSTGYLGSDCSAVYNAQNIIGIVETENNYRQVIILGKSCGGGVDNGKLMLEHIHMRNRCKTLGIRILAWVGGVNSVDILRHKNGIAVRLNGIMHSGGIGRKEGSAESAAVDNYLALFEMVNGAIADIRLGYLVHGNSGHYASGNTEMLKHI